MKLVLGDCMETAIWLGGFYGGENDLFFSTGLPPNSQSGEVPPNKQFGERGRAVYT